MLTVERYVVLSGLKLIYRCDTMIQEILQRKSGEQREFVSGVAQRISTKGPKLGGRISGSKEWRTSRNEDGPTQVRLVSLLMILNSMQVL